MKQVQWIMQSEIGPLFLTASADGLSGVYWKKQSIPLVKTLAGYAPELKWIKEAKVQLEEYFRGDRRDFDLPILPSGTDFQERVWKELRRIPYGKTISYAELAKKIKNEKAVRAVGSANGRNPLSIIVPCHRVIASNGSLAGFAGGVAKKQKLLALERLHLG